MAKTALITGASRGIGAAVAVAFAREGYNIAVNYNKSDSAAEELCEKLSSIGIQCAALKADVSDSASAAAMVAEAYNRFGFIDVLVNNAGISLIKLFTDTTEQEWRSITDTNLSSVYYCCKAVLPAMIREHKGCIVNIASMWGETGASCEVAYSASKAGVIGLTKALAKELAPSGIRVNAVSPGVIMTDMMNGFSAEELDAIKDEIPLGRFGTPEDAAQAALFLASDRAGYITGQVLSVSGGMVI